MKKHAGSVIAMNPKTGDILAFVSMPAFDPNAFSRGIRKEEWTALIGDPRIPLQNKGLQGTYAPGSTVKPFLALTALEAGVMNPTATVFCGGRFRLGKPVVRGWEGEGRGCAGG